MKKFILSGLLITLPMTWGLAIADDNPVRRQNNSTATSNKISEIPAELFDMKPSAKPQTEITYPSPNQPKQSDFIPVEKPALSKADDNKTRMKEIKADGIIDNSERIEYEGILASFQYPDFPVVMEQVSESEPNDDCFSANIVSPNDTVWCADLDGIGLTDTCDYFTFTLDTTFSSWMVELETHDAPSCGTGIGDTKLYLYDSDCLDTLARDDDGGVGNYSKIRMALDPGTYRVAVTPYWNTGTGTYHLSVLATGLIYNVGDHCDNPILVSLPADAPYIDSNQTISGRIDYYNGVTCMTDYDNNEEIIYQLTVTADGWYNIILDPVESSLAGMSLGTDCPPTNCLFFARTFGGRIISQIVYLEAGVGTYYIMVDRQASSGGLTFDLAIDSIAAPPEGEICLNAIQIPDITDYSDTRDQSLYNNNYGYDGKDVVYTFDVTESEVLTFSLCNSTDNWNSVLRLYDAFSCGIPEQELYLIEDPRCYSSLHAKMSYICDPGTYYLVVDADYDEPNEGWYTLEIREHSLPCTDPYYIPPNDNCTDVSPVTIPPGSTYVFTGSNCNASGDCSSYAWPQVWEAFTTLETADITIDYCGTTPAWNRNYIPLMSACPCTTGIEYIPSSYDNYTECPDGNVTLLYEAIPAGTYYYPVLNHPTDYSWGDYVINVHVSGPCNVTFPPGGIDEGEPLCSDDYIDDYNGGCNSEPPVFQPIYSGDAIFGITGMFWDSLGYEARDTDWYEFVADNWYSLEFKVVSESPIQIIIEDGNYNCVPHSLDMEFGNDCDTVYAYASVQPGRYWMFVSVAPWASEFECPQEYAAFFTATQETPHYCDPCFHDNTGGYISNVSFGSINNTSGPEGDPCNYGDYTSLSTQVEQYGTYDLSVSVQSDTAYQYVRAWIDWDQDLLFEDDEYYYLGGGYTPVVVSSDITVPGTALPGQTRMRVIERPWGIDDGEPCTPGHFGKGEAEDYTIEVLAGTPPVFSANPAEIQGAADEGEIDTELLTVSNNGIGDLAFTASVALNPPTPGVTEFAKEFPQNARLVSSVEEKFQPNVSAPLNPSLILQGGDDISTAAPIESIPATLSGTTVGYNDDYYEVCPLAVEGGLDVVYKYSPSEDEYLSFTLCLGNTDFDTRMYIYEDSATAGFPYACNEDHCASPVFPYAWISAIEDLPVYAGHNYYIIIDGYDSNSNGNYVLDVYPGNAPPEPETCGDDSTLILSHDPDDPADGFTSESDLGYKVYENFDVYGEVTDITWWGFDCFNNFYNWSECDVDVDTFEIKFHHDNDGFPGTTIQACTLSVSGEFTGHVFWDLFEEKRYSVTLPTTVFLAGDGWLSIQALTEGDNCWFLWVTSHSEDSKGLQYNGMSYSLLPSDLAVCLSGTHLANWLTIDSEGGLIPSGQFADINVTMDAANLTGGSFSGNINFYANDPDSPNPSIPVTFDVIGSGCGYAVGDVNGNGSYNGLDITYGVAFFKGSPAPLCDPCALCPDWYYCGDVNGSCSYNGLDITYGVAYFKGGPAPISCDDCPPTGGGVVSSVHKRKEKTTVINQSEAGKKKLE